MPQIYANAHSWLQPVLESRPWNYDFTQIFFRTLYREMTIIISVLTFFEGDDLRNSNSRSKRKFKRERRHPTGCRLSRLVRGFIS